MKGVLFTRKILEAKLPVFLATGSCVTRRLIKPQPIAAVAELKEHSAVKGCWIPYTADGRMVNSNQGSRKNDCAYYPRYHTGEVVYLKEAFYAYGYWKILYESGKQHWEFVRDKDFRIQFADTEWEHALTKPNGKESWYKRSPLFLEATDARHFAQVDVRPERLQDITLDDCKAEGIHAYTFARGCISANPPDPRWAFIDLWNSCYPDYPWKLNQFVWRIELKKIERP